MSRKFWLINGLMASIMLALAHYYPHSELLQAWTAVPAIIAGASALYGGYQQNKARQKQDEAMKNQLNMQKEVTPYAQQNLQQGQQALGPTLSYYTSILSNPREASAPEQNRVNTLYAGQAANVRNQMPRGGYGPAAAEQLRAQQRAASESIIQQGRPMAAGGLGNLGSNLMGLGYQGYGLGAGIMNNVFQQGLNARNQALQFGQNIGGGLFNAYQSYMLNRALQTPDTSTNAGSGSGSTAPGTGGSGTYGPAGYSSTTPTP